MDFFFQAGNIITVVFDRYDREKKTGAHRRIRGSGLRKSADGLIFCRMTPFGILKIERQLFYFFCFFVNFYRPFCARTIPWDGRSAAATAFPRLRHLGVIRKSESSHTCNPAKWKVGYFRLSSDRNRFIISSSGGGGGREKKVKNKTNRDTFENRKTDRYARGTGGRYFLLLFHAFLLSVTALRNDKTENRRRTAKKYDGIYFYYY